MREAVSEMSHYVDYDYLIINDDFAHCTGRPEGDFPRQSAATETSAATFWQITG